eukprot:CAMPEP_0174262368 /NCGR_PEP_ID=MMETSP0439-20130205/12932_1 /TAXON_ID=0 /ORGANISM="Stereomyxa ramosa, Strain Chinc5" /LENGTH=526 /DNA_ID=CAMNT_0015347065 /DNA_START=66 /DNA_END=1643 /DNA_ORIENTATION=+
MTNRKLQSEIDRVLKKVSEGSKDFEALLDKVNSTTTNQSKYETDLKKSIKKLQRYREKIKSWIQSNTVKDKRTLVEARKLIEANMEKFKVCEKEMKTKPYSKEGLQQAMQVKEENPNDEVRRWISKCLETLRTQIDQFESETEIIYAKKGRRSTEQMERVEFLKHCVERHHFHEDNLEHILRKLDNETITKEQIEQIQDGVEYYLESNQEPEFYEDEELYEELVGPLIACSPLIPRGGGSSEPTSEDEDVNSDVDEEESEPPFSQVVGSPTTGQGGYRGHQTKSGSSLTQQSGDMTQSTDDNKNTETFSENTVSMPGTLAELAAASLELGGPPRKPNQLNLAHIIQQEQQKPDQLTKQEEQHQQQLQRSYSQQVQQQQQRQQQPPGAKVPANYSSYYDYNLLLLESSMQNLPESIDFERPKQYTPQNPYPTSPYLPSVPSPVFYNPAIFEKFDTDTLFFIFYYQQGTYQQHLAARELKKQSWRYHKKYLTWFQRHKQPKELTNDYEQGTYVYFDYESGWCQRKKTE